MKCCACVTLFICLLLVQYCLGTTHDYVTATVNGAPMYAGSAGQGDESMALVAFDDEIFALWISSNQLSVLGRSLDWSTLDAPTWTSALWTVSSAVDATEAANVTQVSAVDANGFLVIAYAVHFVNDTSRVVVRSFERLESLVFRGSSDATTYSSSNQAAPSLAYVSSTNSVRVVFSGSSASGVDASGIHMSEFDMPTLARSINVSEKKLNDVTNGQQCCPQYLMNAFNRLPGALCTYLDANMHMSVDSQPSWDPMDGKSVDYYKVAVLSNGHVALVVASTTGAAAAMQRRVAVKVVTDVNQLDSNNFLVSTGGRLPNICALHPSAAPLAFVSFWFEPSDAGGGSKLFFQVHELNGTRVGTAVLVGAAWSKYVEDTIDVLERDGAACAATDDGGFLVMWQDDADRISVQRYVSEALRTLWTTQASSAPTTTLAAASSGVSATHVLSSTAGATTDADSTTTVSPLPSVTSTSMSDRMRGMTTSKTPDNVVASDNTLIVFGGVGGGVACLLLLAITVGCCLLRRGQSRPRTVPVRSRSGSNAVMARDFGAAARRHRSRANTGHGVHVASGSSRGNSRRHSVKLGAFALEFGERRGARPAFGAPTYVALPPRAAAAAANYASIPSPRPLRPVDTDHSSDYGALPNESLSTDTMYDANGYRKLPMGVADSRESSASAASSYKPIPVPYSAP